jgi:hypothetical protein
MFHLNTNKVVAALKPLFWTLVLVQAHLLLQFASRSVENRFKASQEPIAASECYFPRIETDLTGYDFTVCPDGKIRQNPTSNRYLTGETVANTLDLNSNRHKNAYDDGKSLSGNYIHYVRTTFQMSSQDIGQKTSLSKKCRSPGIASA